MYYDKRTSVTSKYLVVLYQAVQAMGGGDFCPENVYQVLMSSFGVFMAAYINANIFGELQMLLQSIGIEDQKFDLKKSQIDTAMINMNMPAKLKQQVRTQLYTFAPLELSQRQMVFLMSLLPDSQQMRIIEHENSRYLMQYKLYAANPSFVTEIVHYMHINFYHPEQTIIR